MKIEGEESLLFATRKCGEPLVFLVVQSVEEEIKAPFGMVGRLIQFSTTFAKLNYLEMY